MLIGERSQPQREASPVLMEVAEVDIQATPIRSSQCVLFEVLQSGASRFLETGDGSTEVDWIEV
jgi:hypothetical protein